MDALSAAPAIPLASLLDDPAVAADLERAGVRRGLDELPISYANAAQALHDFASDHREASYDPNDLNGPARLGRPTGTSALRLFADFLRATWGVTWCNKADAVLPAPAGLDLPRTFAECELLKVDNLGATYLRAWAGEATIELRYSPIASLPGSAAEHLTLLSGIERAPSPAWLNRALYFDVGDGPRSGDPSFVTRNFVAKVLGSHVGTSECPERIIDDPAPDRADSGPDGKVHGLRDCADGAWLEQRFPNAPFGAEAHLGRDLMLVLRPFLDAKRGDLFVKFLDLAATRYEQQAELLRQGRVQP